MIPFRTCPQCNTKCPCGMKFCPKPECGKLLAHKGRHTKALKDFRKRAKDWAQKNKDGGNQSKVVDRSFIQIEKLKALGYVPLLMMGKKKRGKSGGWLVEMFFPFYDLQKPAEEVLGKVLALYEEFLQGEVQEMGQQDRQMEEDGAEEGIEQEEEKKKKKKGQTESVPVVKMAARSKRKRQSGDDEVSPEQQERSCSLVEEEPDDPLQRSVGAVKRGAPQPTSDDQLLSPTSHCSESDTEDSDDEWDETSASVKTHMLKHTGEIRRSSTTKTLICEFCGRLFRNRGNLMKHIRLHSEGEKEGENYNCLECGKVFRQMDNLKAHIKIHTKRPRPFTCTVCGKGFLHGRDLTGHLKIHTKPRYRTRHFICTFCDKRFFAKSTLKAHVKNHTKEESCSCTVCGKPFNQKSYLKEHMKVHTGEESITCTVCGKTLKLKASLRKHMLIHKRDSST